MQTKSSLSIQNIFHLVSSTECLVPLLQVLNLFITFGDPRFLDNNKTNPAVIFPIL